MGTFAENLAAVRLRVTSPDGGVMATLEGPGRLAFGFGPGGYPRYDEASLAGQLSALLEDLFAGQRQSRLDAMGEALGHPVDSEDGDGPWDARDRRFMELRSQVESRGRSTGDLIRISNTAMARWRVRLKPGSLARLDERRFLDELSSAVAAVAADYQRRMTAIKLEVYGEGAP